jgi:hypothetical protein
MNGQSFDEVWKAYFFDVGSNHRYRELERAGFRTKLGESGIQEWKLHGNVFKQLP